ncbi:hypothetical protein BH11PLA2_BH11PLA2_00730 [soil metagenome]
MANMRGFAILLLTCCVVQAQDDPAAPPSGRNVGQPTRSAYPVIIRDVRVGLPAGRFVSAQDDNGRAAYVVKNNTWAPVYIWLEIAKEIKKEAAIVIESTDSDKLRNYVSFPLQNLSAELPGTRLAPVDLRFVPYLRSGGNGEVKISIRIPEKGSTPDNWSMLSETFSMKYVIARDVSRYVVLSLGSPLPGFTLPKETDVDETAGTTGSGKALRNGRIETAKLSEVAEMPDQWFGYEAVDLAILCTGTDDKFLSALFGDPANKTRLDALMEWVRRGGKLVISVGRNANIVSQYPLLQELLPMSIAREEPIRQETKLPITWGLSKTNRPLGALVPKSGGTFAVANVVAKADRGVRTLVPPTGSKPVVMQAAFGLGRITMTTFDLDRSPFLDYQDRPEFWDLLLREAGSAKASNGSSSGSTNNNRPYYNQYSTSDGEDEAAIGLRGYIDTFDGVPVISFGWVAVFILLYTLLIGPIEYFFLKKVLKRLELTWITFPIIVLTVSAIAYFTAYAIKGNDLKLNKVDVIEIDPASNRVYGRMWLTVFSPQIDRYTVGMQPNNGWIDTTSTAPQVGSLVDWFGGTNSGRESFISRSYNYKIEPPAGANRDPFGDGLIDVPIPIWSTKAFSADWSGTMDKAAPLVVSSLSHPPADANAVIGSFTLNLPLPELKEAYIIYAGKAWKQENPILSGTPVNVFLDVKQSDSQWLSKFAAQTSMSVMTQPDPRRNTFQNVNGTPTSTGGSAAQILFHEESLIGNDATSPSNSTLRRLDQSWRIHPRNVNEIIVVARLTAVKGNAEEILNAKNSASPTKLWLRSLPGEGKPHEVIPGTLQQDTYVRIYIPIPPVKP